MAAPPWTLLPPVAPAPTPAPTDGAPREESPAVLVIEPSTVTSPQPSTLAANAPSEGAPSRTDDDQRAGNDVATRVEPKRIIYNDDEDDFDPKVCVNARGCTYGHRTPYTRHLCRGWYGVTQLHPFYMIFWTPKDTAYTIVRRILSLFHIIFVAVIASEVVFLVVVTSVDRSYTVASSSGYQFLKGIIVGLVGFIYTNVAREFWKRLYSRVPPQPQWFSCWQDYAMAIYTLALIGMMVGFGHMCVVYYVEQTGETQVQTFVTVQVLIHLAIGLFFTFLVQTGFMFFLGYVPHSWLMYGRELTHYYFRCGPCRHQPRPVLIHGKNARGLAATGAADGAAKAAPPPPTTTTASDGAGPPATVEADPRSTDGVVVLQMLRPADDAGRSSRAASSGLELEVLGNAAAPAEQHDGARTDSFVDVA